MSHIRIFTIAIIAALSSAISAVQAQQITATARLDSAYILMGKTTPLHVEIVGELTDEGAIAMIDTLWTDIEVSSMGEPRIEDLGNNRKQLLQDIIIQSFDSGMYAVPPVLYVQGKDTFATNSPVLKVIPVPVDSLTTVHDYADVATIDRKIFDYVPDWMADYGIWILLALIVIVGAIFVYMKWLRHGRIPLIPAKAPRPPYEVAMEDLERLRGEHLCERGQEKEFYTRLTEILRVYLDKRFGINAMEMISSQILRAVRDNDTTRRSQQQIEQILEVADFVKFAKVRPLPDDNVASFRSAIEFVESTKPTEPAEGDNVNSDTPTTDNKVTDKEPESPDKQ